ncbi:SDR family NAD(P)-dependent oxidoreductase [Mycobacteroides immunogenum]|uniref:2-deoxy-D-gluconate 3-dehydrogenase n=1 Tax=Mycobacteroides immunogenum TaxID=83262 RepID=A0A7V8LMD6_9MYCO|nr:SDR family oxidoreductase [Mycobacteroides immunogenum]AMT72642.1 2-deoxy-D-gluconate 3-dehydrogenase [Mycobacteroides immunogenum]ANO05806.1 2-deoxy-D-gluconate 3-dehydrogenase [Mycobacteroides immunogenum]KIU41038.1 2-deoxy-D-gluconate 3-dehydrogenase [Mycobacteroides immunogenum]KPG05944.1 2-deoxy-D-gluconate 3-dehydrogenase [Mycobacteroides immunogenum]KPG07591.1 2-deoxy-D-gluconate 3-dehydrogenase [Mycobacteroides immunogenum]
MTLLFDLTGHVALITGGNSGIGLGMAHGLAQSGADVCIWGTNAERNHEAAQQLARHGTRVHAIRCDVGDEDAVTASFTETLEHFGRVDSCFANAGTHAPEIRFIDATLADFRGVTRVNLEGAFLTLRAASKHMVERGGGGVLVGTSSVSALHGTPRGQAYAASKAGLNGIIRGCAVELARYGINAHSLIVGWTETPLISREMQDEVFQQNVMKRMPHRRWGNPDDFARIAVYLASGVGGFQTGDEIVIDGGYTVF